MTTIINTNTFLPLQKWFLWSEKLSNIIPSCKIVPRWIWGNEGFIDCLSITEMSFYWGLWCSLTRGILATYRCILGIHFVTAIYFLSLVFHLEKIRKCGEVPPSRKMCSVLALYRKQGGGYKLNRVHRIRRIKRFARPLNCGTSPSYYCNIDNHYGTENANNFNGDSGFTSYTYLHTHDSQTLQFQSVLLIGLFQFSRIQLIF